MEMEASKKQSRKQAKNTFFGGSEQRAIFVSTYFSNNKHLCHQSYTSRSCSAELVPPFLGPVGGFNSGIFSILAYNVLVLRLIFLRAGLFNLCYCHPRPIFTTPPAREMRCRST